MKRVMIVDDNCLTAAGIEKNIDWEALDAQVAYIKYDSHSALNAIKETPVDLIISDIEMPDLDGISMSRLALSVSPLVKIILVSAYDKFEYAKRALRLGVFDYIEKPLDYKYLTEKIRHAFCEADRTRKNMELLKASRPLLTEKFFHRLLHYPGDDAELHLKKYCAELDLNLDYDCYNVLILELESLSGAEAEPDFSQTQLELLNLSNLLEEPFSVFDYTYYLKDFNSITCIIGQNTSHPTHFLQVIHKAAGEIADREQNYRFTLNIGIGTMADSLWKLPLSFTGASHALKYRFFFPHKNIFDAREALGKDFSLLSFSEVKEEELLRLICGKESEKIRMWLTDFFQELAQKVPDKNLVFIRIYSLLGRILKFLYEMNLDTEDIEQEILGVYKHFDSFPTYEDFIDWIAELCRKVCDKLDSSLQSYHNQVYSIALGYIKENYENSTLCLNDIARHANISPAYLSSLFKKVSGSSISDTIAALRTELACHYLRSSSLSLKEISAKCGYANQYYFSNSFKKRLGMSPSAYREKAAPER